MFSALLKNSLFFCSECLAMDRVEKLLKLLQIMLNVDVLLFLCNRGK